MNDIDTSTEPRSLATELADVRKAFPSALIDGEGWQHLLARAAAIPASFIENTFGFELRLGESKPAADFCITIQAGSDKATEYLNFPAVKNFCDVTDPDESLQHDLRTIPNESSAVKALTNLLSEIARDGSFANDAVRGGSIILEHDLVETSPGQSRAPGVFWGLAEHIGAEQMGEVVQMLDIASNPAMNPPFDDQPQKGYLANDGRVCVLRDIAEATVPYGRISQVGTFVGRETTALRILVRILEHGSIGEFLSTIGWSGNIDKTIDGVSSFNFENTDFGVSLDVAPNRVGTRIGLEVAARGGWYGTRSVNWRPLIDVLVANRWCRTSKARGLLDWCGYMPLFGRQMYMLLKGINHFKISIRNDELLDAKAYLGACRVPAKEIGFK